jgi:hypothetical protein
MARHTIWDHEIKAIMVAANQLFSPQEGGGDDRSAFQTIHHILEDVKIRTY